MIIDTRLLVVISRSRSSALPCKLTSSTSTKEFDKVTSVGLIRPDIQSFLGKLKREQETKLNAQENDNRPFVLKYVRNEKQNIP